MTYDEQGKTDEAIAAYRQAIELGTGGAALDLGVLLQKLGRLSSEEPSIQRLLANSRSGRKGTLSPT